MYVGSAGAGATLAELPVHYTQAAPGSQALSLQVRRTLKNASACVLPVYLT